MDLNDLEQFIKNANLPEKIISELKTAHSDFKKINDLLIDTANQKNYLNPTNDLTILGYELIRDSNLNNMDIDKDFKKGNILLNFKYKWWDRDYNSETSLDKHKFILIMSHPLLSEEIESTQIFYY